MSTAARIDELRKKFEENSRRYFAPLANELRKAGDLSQAIALCREHLPKQPGHMSGYIVFGQALYESGQLDEARSVFEQALALDPENLIALHHLGHIARQQGDTAAARRWYERALETDPRNDDIAHQLAALATPVRPQPTIPTPVSQAAALDEMSPADRAAAQLAMLDLGAIPARRDLGAIPTPPFPQAAVGVLPPTPTPDAALRALDFDVVNASLQPPSSAASGPSGEALDLDAIESAGQGDAPLAPFEAEPIDLSFDVIDASGVETAADPAPVVVEDSSLLEPSGETVTDDPFAFADVPAEIDGDASDVATVDLEAHFEEGLVAESWPDTAELMPRANAPRSATPASVDIPVDAIEAFGREPMDPIAHPLPQPEPDVLGDEADLVAATMEPPAHEEPLAESTAPGLDTGTSPVAESTPAAPIAAVVATQEVDDALSDADPREELPWLAAPVTPSEDVAAIAEALEADARASGEPEVVSMFTTTETEDEPESLGDDSALELETSFSDMMSPETDEAPIETPSLDSESEEMPSVAAEAPPAFVTETMGELLVAQGFTDRAIAVYEELVRRRPYDPVLGARLEELRESHAAPAALPVPAYTARDRFAALAARRVSRRTPPYATPIVTQVVASAPTPVQATPVSPVAATDSLADLFGVDAPTPDDQAAQALAQAFAPEEVDRAAVADGFSAAFFGGQPREATPAYGAVRQPTPVRAPTPVVPTPVAPTPVAPRAVAPSATEPAGEFSFDRFFPDPAVNVQGAGSSTPAAPMPTAGGTPEGTTPESPASPGVTDDLAQFSAWLKGLGNP